MSTQSDLAELYTTFFNRAPDADGLAYWVNSVDTGQLSLTQIAENWLTEQPEGQTNFPTTLTDAQFVAKIYTNVLSRTADADGAQYWLDQLASGAVTRDSFALSIINGAKANTSAQGVLDATLISNKATVGVAFAEQGVNDTALAAKVLTTVTADASTLNSTLAVIALIPTTAAAQTPAILAATTQLLTNFANLITTAPGELADATTYLQTLAAGITSGTNITTLLSNANTLITSAATNSAALDNPAVKGAADVVVATPGSGGGGTPAPTFTAVETAGDLAFGGSATGDITVAITGDSLVFSRGGVDAASVSLASLTSIQGTQTLSLTLDQYISLNPAITTANDVKVADTSNVINSNLSGLLGDAKVDTIDSTENTVAINLTAAQSIVTANTAKLVAGDLIAVVDTSANINANLTALLANTKVDTINSSDDGIAISLTAAQAIVTANIAKLDAGDLIAVVDTSSAINGNLAALLANTKIDTINSSDNGIAINLTAAQAIVTANTAKLVVGDLIDVLDSSSAINANLTALLSNPKIDTITADDSPASFTLTAVQAALPGATAKLASYDIIVVDTSAAINAGLTALLADANITTIDSNQNNVAINLTAAQGAITANTDKLVAGDLITVADTSASINTNLTVLLAETKVDSINSSDNGIAINLLASQVTAANFAKLDSGDTIDVIDTGANLGGKLSDLVTNAAKVDLIDASDDELTLTASQASALGSKLSAGDVVTITNTLAQGNQVITGGFQSADDKLFFTAADLTSATGFTNYGGVGASVVIDGSIKAELVVSTGGGLVASTTGAAFLFDTASGALTFDADGNGAGAAIPIITLSGVASLTAANFEVLPSV